MGEGYRHPSAGPAVMVSGMIAATPFQGGATWAVLQYLLGLRALGCDVTFVEPVDHCRGDRATYCAGVMSDVGLARRWCLIGDDHMTAGMDYDELLTTASSTDVLINVSGMLTHREVLERVGKRVYLDLDPGFVQMWHDSGVDMRFDAHDVFVTLADNIGTAGSPVPACGRNWIPTLPPVVLNAWQPDSETSIDAFTTVAHWRSYGSILRDGVQYGQKAHSLRPLFDLPRRIRERFCLALAIHPEETADLAVLGSNGWELVDPRTVAGSPRDYRRFVQGSLAELGIAKQGYVASRSGWFSDRSACYLASGRPVVAQDTGFGRRLPTGAGLFAFGDADDVAAAVDEIRRDPSGQRAAARALAEEHLASDIVLGRLLEHIA